MTDLLVGVRRAVADDLNALRAIYAQSVKRIGPSAYTAQQVAAWISFAQNPHFRSFILDVHTYVAAHHNEVFGFCGIDVKGHIASIYVHPDLCRRGVARKLFKTAIERHPSPRSGRYYAEASHFSLPLFLNFGFHHYDTEQVARNGVRFERFLVSKKVA